MTSLAEHLAGQYDAPEDEQARAGYVLHDDGHACWALRKLAEHQQASAAVSALAAEQRALVDEWEQAELERVGRDIAWFEGILADYWRRQLLPQVDELMAQGKTFDEAWAAVKTKSKRLPAGTISAAKGRDSISIEDEDQLVAWAEKHAPDVLVTVVKPSREALTRYNRDGAYFVTADGEKVPGVLVQNPGITWKAKPATE